VQVVDVGDIHQTVHRGVDRRCGAALAVQAVVECRDHLVLALEPRVHVDERAHPVEPQHRQALLGEGAEVAARSLHPHELHRLTGDRVGCPALRGGVASREVRVLRIGAEAVRPGDQRACDGVGHGCLQG
jgi:hypothetical protein